MRTNSEYRANIPRDRSILDAETKFRNKLNAAWELYNLKDELTNIPRDSLISYTVSLLTKHETVLEFCGSHERLLLALAVANSLKNETSAREIRALLRILKLISAGVDDHAKQGSYSRRVLRVSEKKLKSGTRFDALPSDDMDKTGAEHRMVELLVKKHEDREASLALKAELTNFGDDCILAGPRKKLGINMLNEGFFVPIITNLTRREFEDTFKYLAFKTHIDGSTHLVFPQVPTNHLIQHEYVHSQEKNRTLNFGLYRLLGRGLNEISVELLTDEPLKYSYTHLAPLWKNIKNKIPDIENKILAVKSSTEQEFDENLRDLRETLIYGLGLQGFLDISRLMSGGIHGDFLTVITRSVLLPVSEVSERLGIRYYPVNTE